MTEDPLLAALLDEYGMTLERLQRSFVGPPQLDVPAPAAASEFARAYGGEGERADVSAFRELQAIARASAGLDPPTEQPDEGAYEQYREWLPFAHRNRVVLGRIADALGYERPSNTDPGGLVSFELGLHDAAGYP